MIFNVIQPYATLLTINGVNLITPNLEIESVDDAVITDFPTASVIDSLRFGPRVGCLRQIQQAVQTSILDRSGFTMFLYGQATSLPIASLPANVAAWNTFDLRRELIGKFERQLGRGNRFSGDDRFFRASSRALNVLFSSRFYYRDRLASS